jgi:Family of unknown function (DUF6502)
VNQAAVTSADVSERRAFEDLLEKMLTPLMPIAISYGMSANEVSLVTRAVYLRVMEARLRQDRGHQVSDARLALVSGLTRREVEQARGGSIAKDSSRSELAEQLYRIAVVLSAWHTNPKFAGAYGVPLDLDLKPSEERPHHSFTDLIETACAGLPQAVTLDELIAQGVVEVINNTIVRCKSRALIANPNIGAGKEGRLATYGRFLAAATGTVAHNVQAEDPSQNYFDRILTSDVPLSDRMRKQFLARSVSSTDAFLTELDSWLSKNAGEATDGSGCHYGVGVFFFAEEKTGSFQEQVSRQNEV